MWCGNNKTVVAVLMASLRNSPAAVWATNYQTCVYRSLDQTAARNGGLGVRVTNYTMCHLQLMWLACWVLLVYTVSVRAHELSETKETTKTWTSIPANDCSHLEHVHLLRLSVGNEYTCHLWRSACRTRADWRRSPDVVWTSWMRWCVEAASEKIRTIFPHFPKLGC